MKNADIYIYIYFFFGTLRDGGGVVSILFLQMFMESAFCNLNIKTGCYFSHFEFEFL